MEVKDRNWVNELTAFTKVAPASPIKVLVFFIGVCRTETRRDGHTKWNISQHWHNVQGGVRLSFRGNNTKSLIQFVNEWMDLEVKHTVSTLLMMALKHSQSIVCQISVIVNKSLAKFIITVSVSALGVASISQARHGSWNCHIFHFSHVTAKRTNICCTSLYFLTDGRLCLHDWLDKTSYLKTSEKL